MTTNREKLAKMTNKELAEMLGKQDCKYCIYKNVDCYRPSIQDYDCEKGILQWLNQESKEE